MVVPVPVAGLVAAEVLVAAVLLPPFPGIVPPVVLLAGAPVPAGTEPVVDAGKVVIGVGASGTGLDKAEATRVSISPAAGSFLWRSL